MSDVIPDEPVNDPPPVDAAAPSHEETDTEPENTEELLGEELERLSDVQDDEDAEPEAEATEGDPGEAGAEEGASATAGTVEVEWGGQKYSIPKGAEAGFMVQSDYTQKTQALAEKSRQLQGREQQFKEQVTRSDEDRHIDAQHLGQLQQLQEYSQIDWATWVRQDPDAANPAYIEYQELQGQARQTRADIDQRGQYRQQEQQAANDADLQARLSSTREYAKAEIPGWSEELEQQNLDYALEAGIKFEDLQNAMSPAVYRILHDARLGRALQNKPQQRPKAQTKASSTVGSAAGVSLNAMDPDDMSMEQFAKWRNYGR